MELIPKADPFGTELTKRAKSAENVTMASTVKSPSRSSQKKQAVSKTSNDMASASAILPLSEPRCTSMSLSSQILHPAAITPPSLPNKVTQPRLSGWNPPSSVMELDSTTKADSDDKVGLELHESEGSVVAQLTEESRMEAVVDPCVSGDCLSGEQFEKKS
jgi:hypothetical protein